MSGAPDLGPRFSPIRRLGTGGAAESWLVEDSRDTSRVVAKVLLSTTSSDDASSDDVTLLQREFEITRRLDHPNIVSVYDLHHEGDRLFITMEFIDGGDAALLRARPAEEIVPVVRLLAEALEHAHSRGIVHRDLKTANVLLDKTRCPHLADFGIAGADIDSREIAAISGGGSRQCMSPQQLLREPPTAADDIYGLGTLVYELISGCPPFWPETTDDQILTAKPEPLRSGSPLPRGLQSLVLRMLEKDPSQRPPHMAAVILELLEIEHDLAEQPRPEPPRPRNTPIRLTPPPRVGAVHPAAKTATSGETSDAGKTARRPKRWLHILIVAVLGVALATVFFVLPRWVERRPSPAPEANTPAPDLPPPTGVAADAGGPSNAIEGTRERALESLELVMKLDESLRNRGVEQWGNPPYTTAREHMSAGDDSLKTGDHGVAAAEYDQAIVLLRGLSGRVDRVFADALEGGRRGLEEGDSKQADSAFRLALAVSPDHRAAKDGLRRAGVLDELLTLMTDGEEAYRSGDTSRAEQIFERAVSLDPESPEARAALARSRQRMKLDSHNNAIGEGLSGLDREDYEAARNAFKRAAALRPGSPESTEGIARAEVGLRSQTIKQHQNTASSAEASEDWRAALAAFEAALALDPALAFAIEGRDRSRLRLQLAEEIDYHLEHPGRLQSPEVLDEASELLDDARATRPGGPVITRQIGRLETLIEAASTPITVELLSDNLTDVLVYRVGRLGSFSHHSLELRPGTYTIVGARDGYRDVRLQLVVRPGQAVEPLVVRCEEEL